ncbi:zinc knuckle CX2CX4HX4C [Artemisia annua]|uniref:Zinc knuckle CX2CX4HX4C n=1 Tax=Artemisia annua TaxID=35608 RepID=A0A2U1KK11_ARTAN|nr:zinc knuckle CX2CX4HX4C [Artemisia annua]
MRNKRQTRPPQKLADSDYSVNNTKTISQKTVSKKGVNKDGMNNAEIMGEGAKHEENNRNVEDSQAIVNGEEDGDKCEGTGNVVNEFVDNTVVNAKVQGVCVADSEVQNVNLNENGCNSQNQGVRVSTDVNEQKKADGDTSQDTSQLGVGRMGFARVLVEMNTTKEIPEVIEVVYRNGNKEELCRKKVTVAYDWTPPRCSTCCVFGHTTMKCGKKCVNEEPSKNEEVTENNEKDNSDGFEKVKKRFNGKGGDSNKQHNHKENAKKEVPKPAAKFVYQPKSNRGGGTSNGNGKPNE